MPTENIDLPTLIQRFSNEDACHAYLEDLRWPDGPACPGRKRKNGERVECGSERVARLQKRRLFECQECGYQFSTRVGTIFEDSKLPLWKWFLAVYMMVQSKKGISANQLKRMLGVSYKTAWYLCHRIRKAMEEDSPSWLKGTVEVDESFVGGKVRGRPKGHSDNWKNKVIVAAAVERGGKARLRVVPNRTQRTLKKFIDKFVHDSAQAIYTDDHKGYANLGDADTTHTVVVKNPRKDGRRLRENQEWVSGQVHTNTVEGIFSLLDRSIIGAYHKVSKKHLSRYLNEVEWKYNNRENPYLFRDAILKLIEEDRLEYEKLTA